MGGTFKCDPYTHYPDIKACMVCAVSSKKGRFPNRGYGTKTCDLGLYPFLSSIILGLWVEIIFSQMSILFFLKR